MVNEFETLDDDFPEALAADVPVEDNSMIAGSNAGVVYDYNTAPDTIKAPPRMNLNGKTVTIKKADIILPPISKPWEKTRDKKKDYKYCTFKLYYDVDGQQEFISGVRIFKTDDGKYSHPTITKDRVSQASMLMGKYADWKKKDINEVTLREFMSFLNSQPKAKIRVETTRNPTTNEEVKKNMIDLFI